MAEQLLSRKNRKCALTIIVVSYLDDYNQKLIEVFQAEEESA